MNSKPDKHSKYFSSDGIADFIEQLENRVATNDFERIIMNPVDTGKLHDHFRASHLLIKDDKVREPIILGMDVTYSPYIEQGTAILVEKQSDIFPTHYGFDLEKFNQDLMNVITSAFGIPYRYFEQQPERPYRWQRYPGENILEWGNRLFKRDLLDNPDIRWEYQKAVLSAAFVVPVQALIRIIRERKSVT